ncbi:MAG: right-handed parallel beta-helix repeat-containing protein [Pseudomonadota bacterium]
MHRLISFVALSSALLLIAPARAADMPDLSGALFVCQATGDNKNPGSKDKPYKNIDKAAKEAKTGQVIAVCEGTYAGTFDIGYVEFKKAVKLYGSYSPDFSARSLAKHATRFAPDNASGAKARKALFKFTGEVKDAVVDGFILDMGGRNSYHPTEGKPDGLATGMLTLPPAKGGDDKPTVTEPCLSIPSAAKEGDMTFSNNVFANCASFGIQAGLRGGTLKIRNNLFVANRMAAVEAYGTCRAQGSGPSAKLTTVCGNVDFGYNTVLFTWSRIKDLKDMGYGFRVMTMVSYDIHNNIFGGNVQGGVDHTRFNQNPLKLDNNIFFVNKAADFEYSPASNTKLTLTTDKFGDLEFASVTGNETKIPKTLPVDKAYLEGFLNVRYSEKLDYNPDSPANQFREAMGMNKQGKMSSKVSMYGNRYPTEQAAGFFGAVADRGTQAF